MAVVNIKEYYAYYTVVGVRFLFSPMTSSYAPDPGNAELRMLIETQRKYPGKEIIIGKVRQYGSSN